jgi:hypothetical protein
MKALKILVVGMMLILGSSAHAQVSVNVNIGSPPPWGPVGYSQVHYYYLPDVEAYYDVQASMFIYYGGGVWVHRAYLPTRYKNYDLYGGYKVVMTDYHGNAPYTHFKEHKMKYAKGYHGKYQRTVGEKPGKGHADPKNYHNDNHGNNGGNGSNGKNAHGDNNNMKKDHGNGNGNGKKK